MHSVGIAMTNMLIILGMFTATVVIPVIIGSLTVYMIITSGIYFYKQYKNKKGPS